jgi:signal transduction histidine kinase
MTLYTDQGRLTQIVTNLIGNAVKFTCNGEVALNVVVENNRLAISVVDSGIGIPSEKLETIFERFRKSGAESTLARGVGLGLSISQKLAELLGGELTVKSELNVGSTFTFQIDIDILVQE